MPKSARKTDPDNAGGQVASAVSDDIIVNNKPMALLNSVESAHAPWGPPHPPHDAPTIVSASDVVIGNNRGAAYVGSSLSCGHQIVDGSPDVIVGLSGGGGGGPAKSAVVLKAETTQTPQTAEDRKSIAASKQVAQADPETVKQGIAKGEPTNQQAEAAAPGSQQENVLEDKIWQTLQANLEVCLEEARTGGWKETGKKTGTSNPNIMACYKAVGCPQPDDDTAWCAGFAGAMMKKAGAKYLKTLLSRAYVNYGQQIPLNDPTQWRMNDVVIFQRPGGGHIGFVKAVDPVGKRLIVVGGNQGDNLTQTVFKFDGSVKLTDVRRGWTLPAAANVSIVTTNIAAAPPNIKVT